MTWFKKEWVSEIRNTPQIILSRCTYKARGLMKINVGTFTFMSCKLFHSVHEKLGLWAPTFCYLIDVKDFCIVMSVWNVCIFHLTVERLVYISFNFDRHTYNSFARQCNTLLVLFCNWRWKCGIIWLHKCTTEHKRNKCVWYDDDDDDDMI